MGKDRCDHYIKVKKVADEIRLRGGRVRKNTMWNFEMKVEDLINAFVAEEKWLQEYLGKKKKEPKRNNSS